MNRIHIGEMITEKLKEVGMTKAELARRLYLSRQVVGTILAKPNMDVERLQQISKVLKYNFLEVICNGQESVTPQLITIRRPLFSIDLPVYTQDDFEQLIDFLKTYNSGNQIVWPSFS